MTSALQIAFLFALVIVGPIVVRTREPAAQTMALTFYGFLLGVTFLLFQAPDVALAQLVVGAVLLPILVLLTLARMRRKKQQAEQQLAKREQS